MKQSNGSFVSYLLWGSARRRTNVKDTTGVLSINEEYGAFYRTRAWSQTQGIQTSRTGKKGGVEGRKRGNVRDKRKSEGRSI
jgi:hypothetical protein